VVELTYLSVSPMWRDTTVAACAGVARRLGAERVVLSSDAGQRHNPSPPEALRAFAQSVHEAGVPAADVLRMLGETARGLLGW
jgi:predicted metal-dependent TIM-barrel fold hydrolase